MNKIKEIENLLKSKNSKNHFNLKNLKIKKNINNYKQTKNIFPLCKVFFKKQRNFSQNLFSQI